jgi:putative lipoprotein (rSAM/lipoprotein system)
MKRNWRRKLLGGLSLTSALFIFQACYGTPQDLGMDIYIEGRVRSLKTNLPVEGIKVSIAANPQYQVTDANGKFSFYTETADSYNVKLEDIDNSQNGIFTAKDTLFTMTDKHVYLEFLLEEK